MIIVARKAMISQNAKLGLKFADNNYLEVNKIVDFSLLKKFVSSFFTAKRLSSF